MPKKIVITGTRGIPHIMGGVEAVVEEIAPRLVGLGYDVTVIRRSNYVNPEVDKECGVEVLPSGEMFWKGVRLLDVASPKKKSFEAIVHTWRALFAAKRMGADIVHINAIGPALVTPVARALGMKVVFHHHGPDYDRDKWGFAAKTMLKMGEWFGCKFANHTLVISDVIRNIVADRCHVTKNVSLVYNGVSSPTLVHDPEYFSQLGIEEGKYILGMCRFVPEKHLHDLVAAYVKLKEAGRIPADIKLVLAGDTDFEDEYSISLKAQAREAGVVLTGFVQGGKKFSLLTGALCYSLPSSHEGLPIALLEAMSYELPVVVSAIPANLEVGLDADRYFSCGDVDALAMRLEVICGRATGMGSLASGMDAPVSELEPNCEQGSEDEAQASEVDAPTTGIDAQASEVDAPTTGIDAQASGQEVVYARPLERVKYDMAKYDWDVIARQISGVYEGL